MTRRLVALATVVLLAAGFAACGGDDDDDAVASGDGTTTTVADDPMDMGDDDAADDEHMVPEVNPCGPDGDGTLPGMAPDETAADRLVDRLAAAPQSPALRATEAAASNG
jgi:hypothetical protein